MRACKLPDIKIRTHGCAHIQKLKLFQYQINRRCADISLGNKPEAQELLPQCVLADFQLPVPDF